jgi:predicted methyltransferase
MERRMKVTLIVPIVILSAVASLTAQQRPDAAQIKQERDTAEKDAPQLAEVLQIKPGMTIADIGAGGGAFTVVLGRLFNTGKVYATDIGKMQLEVIADYVKREGLTNVTVLEGAPAATNLPAACCDAMFMRDVYHHITAVDAFTRSLFASLKPGGRIAILDFRPRPNSKLPDGVNPNRGGHGIAPATIEEEMKAAGFTHVRTVESWPPGENSRQALFLVLFTK